MMMAMTVTLSPEKDNKLSVPGQPSASEVNNFQLSQVLTDKDGVICSSTEEMETSIEAVNLSLFSKNVSAWHQSHGRVTSR